jgi:nicotinamidase-related amidase
VNEKLDPTRTALIVVDMQRNAYEGDDARSRLLRGSGVAARLAELVQVARERGVLIVYIMSSRRPDGGDQVPARLDSAPAGGGRPVEGTAAWQVIVQLQPASEDYFVVKRRRSGFYGTDLDLVLRSRGITTLIVGGQRTTLGVEGTMRDAFDRDYAVIALSDGCGGVPDDEQAWTVQRVFPQMARVRTCAEAAALL